MVPLGMSGVAAVVVALEKGEEAESFSEGGDWRMTWGWEGLLGVE